MRKCENAKIAEKKQKMRNLLPQIYQTRQPSTLGKRAAVAALGSD
jgi:hypothetical protein